MHKDLLIVQVVFQTFCIYSQGKYFGWFFKTSISLLGQEHAPGQGHALLASKAIAQTEPEGNKTEPVEKLLKSDSFAGLPLTWKTWKVREFERDP